MSAYADIRICQISLWKRTSSRNVLVRLVWAHSDFFLLKRGRKSCDSFLWNISYLQFASIIDLQWYFLWKSEFCEYCVKIYRQRTLTITFRFRIVSFLLRFFTILVFNRLKIYNLFEKKRARMSDTGPLRNDYDVIMHGSCTVYCYSIILHFKKLLNLIF